MENSPLTDRSVAEEEDTAFRGSASRRSLERELAATRTHSRGAGSRVRSWMRVGAVDWGIRIAVVGLVIGGFFAIYVNGVAEGWWHAWGETPTVAATGPTAAPTPAPTVSSEPAMSGGYAIGPDGVLVRPAEFAADTYTKPELPEEAKENTERGAEAAAEHYLALLVYAWNTGDTQPFADMSDPNSAFANTYVTNIGDLYKVDGPTELFPGSRMFFVWNQFHRMAQMFRIIQFSLSSILSPLTESNAKEFEQRNRHPNTAQHCP